MKFKEYSDCVKISYRNVNVDLTNWAEYFKIMYLYFCETCISHAK